MSVYNFIVVGCLLPLLIHMQMTHSGSCAVLIIRVLLFALQAQDRGAIRESSLVTHKKTHSCARKSSSKQHARAMLARRGHGAFFTLYKND